MDRYDRKERRVISYPFEENNLSMIPASYPVDDLKILKILLAISCTKNKSLLQCSQKTACSALRQVTVHPDAPKTKKQAIFLQMISRCTVIRWNK